MLHKAINITATIIIVLWIGGCERGNPVAAVGDSPLVFPLAKGNTWTYDHTVIFTSRETTSTRTCSLDSPITFMGLQWYGMNNFCLECDAPVRLSPTPLVCVLFARDGTKFLAARSGGPAWIDQEVILDLPLTPGKAWTIFSRDTTYVIPGGDTIHELRLSRRHMLAVEPVKVPAGVIWNCYHIEDSTLYFSTAAHPGGGADTTLNSIITHEWFALGIGLVRQVVTYINNNEFADIRSTRDELRGYAVHLDEGH